MLCNLVQMARVGAVGRACCRVVNRPARRLASLVVITAGCAAVDPDGLQTTGGSTASLTSESSSSGGATGSSSGVVDDTSTGATSTATGSSGPDPLEDTTAADGAPIFDVGIVPDSPADQPAPPTDIDVVITADNAYAFGYGDESMMATYFGGVAAVTAGEIFNCGPGPEQYAVPAQDTAEYLYIVAYGDTATTQGVIGQFRRVSDRPEGAAGEVVYTGDVGWEVCATGVDYNAGDAAPLLEVINEQIELCNQGQTDPETTSVGWVDEIGTAVGALAVGETNETPYVGGAMPGNEFPLVCQAMIDAAAKWMWFNWDPENIVWPAQSPFLYPGGAGNPMHDFMIFRLATEVLPAPPAG